MESTNSMEKIGPILSELESKVNYLKISTGKSSNGKTSPISKTMGFSISMVNQISKTMQDMINQFEEKLATSKQELNIFSAKLDARDQINLEDDSLKENVGDEIPGLDGNALNKNRFTASRAEKIENEQTRAANEELETNVQKIFLAVETKHGITRTSNEIKNAAAKILRGDQLLFVKANLMSNYHLLYDVLHIAKKKVAVLFLQPAMMKVYRRIIPQEIAFVTMNQIMNLPDIDVLFIENCELFEDLPHPELKGLKHFLLKTKCTKVLVSNLMTFRAFSIMKDQISVPFSGIALPGLKVENLGITASNDPNKSLSFKTFLRTTSNLLQPGEKMLILTNSQSEANELYKFISSSCQDVMNHLRLKDIHFGPINNPPLNSVFSFVVYFSLPSKLEQFFCHISTLYNNYYYRHYGKLTELPKIHFHVFVCKEDFTNLRFKIFLKKVTRLQINRVLKRLDDVFQQIPDEDTNEKVAKGISLMDFSKFSDMDPKLVIAALRHCQGEKLIAVNQPYPVSYSMRVVSNLKDNQALKTITDNSKKSGGLYKVKVFEIAKILDIQPSKTVQLLKTLQTEGNVQLQPLEELIDIKFFGPVAPRMGEVSQLVYKRMIGDFELEKSLLDFMYASFMMGSAKGDNLFCKKQKQRLSIILRHYSMAEYEQIPKIYEQSMFDSIMEPIKGLPHQKEEIAKVLYHLLRENKNTFLEKEIQMCRGKGGPIAAEYVVHAMAKTMCGQPPKRVSLFDLSIKTSNIDFQKMDFDEIVRIGEGVLEKFLTEAV